MMILSFSWTTPALLAGAKSCTRRDWSPRHRGNFHAGDLVRAYDKSPRAGGKPIAIIRLTETPIVQNTIDLTPDDWHAEGFEWMRLSGNQQLALRAHSIWADWTAKPRDLTVIRFETVEFITPEVSSSLAERRAFMKQPLEYRRRIMSKQAPAIARHYNNGGDDID